MTPVYQTCATVPGGDCFKACVASVLDLPLEEVPHFLEEDRSDHWWLTFDAWLKKRGCCAFHYEFGKGHPLAAMLEGLCIVGVQTSPPVHPTRDDWIHAVVMTCRVERLSEGRIKHHFDLVHDPLGGCVIAEIRDAFWIIRNVL